MGAYTQEQAEQIVEKYKPAILRQVRKYYDRRRAVVSGEDLYQDAVEALLRNIKKQDSDKQYIFPTMDIKQSIVKGIMNGLTLHYGRDEGKFRQAIQEPLSYEYCSDVIEPMNNVTDDGMSDMLFAIDYERFLESLSPKEFMMVQMVLSGMSWSEAGEAFGITHQSASKYRKKVFEKYRQMMQ